jgi:hypothetical protein
MKAIETIMDVKDNGEFFLHNLKINNLSISRPGINIKINISSNLILFLKL